MESISFFGFSCSLVSYDNFNHLKKLLYKKLLGNTLFEGFLLILIAGLAEQSKHIFLIALDARLIKRDLTPQNVTSKLHRPFQRNRPYNRFVFVGTGQLEHQVRNPTVVVGENCALKGLAVDKGHGLSGEEVEPVAVVGLFLFPHPFGTVNQNHGFENAADAVLNILSEE